MGESTRVTRSLASSFDATYLYEYTLLMLFNLVFTSLPVAILGILDQDVDAKTSMAYPQLYRRGILGKEWTRRRFFGYMLDGLYQSAIAFGVPYFVFAWSTTHSTTGHDFALWELGTTVAACAVTAANLFVGLNIRYWTWMVFVIIIASTLAFHVWIAIYSQFQTFFFQNEVVCTLPVPRAFRPPATTMIPHLIYSVPTDLYGTAQFWFSMILVQIVAIGPKYLTKYVRSTYFPRDNDIIRELRVAGPRKVVDREADLESATLPPASPEQYPLVRAEPPLATPPVPKLGVVGGMPEWVEPLSVSPAPSPAPAYRSAETSPSLAGPTRFLETPLTESDLMARSPLDAAHRQWRNEATLDGRTPSPAQSSRYASPLHSPTSQAYSSPLHSPQQQHFSKPSFDTPGMGYAL